MKPKIIAVVADEDGNAKLIKRPPGVLIEDPNLQVRVEKCLAQSGTVEEACGAFLKELNAVRDEGIGVPPPPRTNVTLELDALASQVKQPSERVKPHHAMPSPLIEERKPIYDFEGGSSTGRLLIVDKSRRIILPRQFLDIAIERQNSSYQELIFWLYRESFKSCKLDYIAFYDSEQKGKGQGFRRKPNLQKVGERLIARIGLPYTLIMYLLEPSSPIFYLGLGDSMVVVNYNSFLRDREKILEEARGIREFKATKHHNNPPKQSYQ